MYLKHSSRMRTKTGRGSPSTPPTVVVTLSSEGDLKRRQS
jgi:hypothetical protein